MRLSCQSLFLLDGLWRAHCVRHLRLCSPPARSPPCTPAFEELSVPERFGGTVLGLFWLLPAVSTIFDRVPRQYLALRHSVKGCLLKVLEVQSAVWFPSLGVHITGKVVLANPVSQG